MVTVDRTSLDSFLPPHQLERMVPQLQAAWDTLWKGTGAGNDFLGWRDLPVDYDRAEFQRIQAAAHWRQLSGRTGSHRAAPKPQL